MSIRDLKAVRRFETFTLPCGAEIRIRSLFGSEKRHWRKLTPSDKDGNPNPRSDHVIIAMSVVDKDGNPEVTEDEALAGFFDNKLDFADEQRIMRRVLRLNGMLDDDISVEGAIKNSGAIPGNGSSGG